MDGRGRLAQPLNKTSAPGLRAAPAARRVAGRRAARALIRGERASRLERRVGRYARVIARFRLARGGGIAASILIVLASIGYGTVKGDHLGAASGWLRDGRDRAANALSFRVNAIALSGNSHLNREEILSLAGITGNTSLPFFNVADARAKLMANPWIAATTIQKLYPDRLQITLTEREAFALWQKDGRISVVAADGTVMEPYVSRPFAHLPLVIGPGAERQAKDFLALLDRYPGVRDQLQAAILVGERRWNLRLRSGIDVRLPEAEPERALDKLVALDRDKKLLSRDIATIDLRLPDRVTVGLSASAARARDAANTEKARQRKAGSA